MVDAGTPLPDGVVAIETVVLPQAFSGEEVDIRCDLLTAEGQIVLWPTGLEPVVTIGTAGTIVPQVDGTYLALAAGTTTVTCSVNEIVDATSSNVTILPGAPATVTTIVSRDTVDADPSDPGTDVTCEVRDAGGNLLPPDDATIELGNPFAGSLTGANAHFTVAGLQNVGCILPGAITEWADVTVNPGKPAVILLALDPAQSVYAPGSTVTASVVVQDSYGNVADSSNLVVSSSPAATTHVAGTMTFSYANAGTFVIEARIDTDTATGSPIVETVPVLVNDGAPSITCQPAMRTITGAAGATWNALTVTGNVTDQNGIMSVTINGNAVTLDGSGNYSANVDPDFGANCYLVVATDTQNEVHERCCPYIASELYSTEIAMPTWQNPGPGSISLAISQRGLDDHTVNGTSTPATSIGDILDRGITPTSLGNYLHAYFTRANNPGGQNYIGTGTATIGSCPLCVSVDVDVYYDPNIADGRIALTNPNINADLIAAGLRTSVLSDQFKLGLWFEITGAPSWLNSLVASLSTGVATMSNLSALADWDVSAGNGKFATTQLGGITLNYASLTSTNGLVNLVASILPNVVKNAIQDVLNSVVGPIVQDLLGSITIDTFGIAVPLPKLDGSGNATIAISGSFTQADADASSLRAVIAPYFVVTGGTPQARPSSGVASQSNPVTALNPVPTALLDPNGTPGNIGDDRAIAMALHDSAVNDLMHRLWRASYFDGTLDINTLTAPAPNGFGIDLGSLTGILASFDLAMTAPLPPVAELLANGNLRIGLAGVRVALTVPGSSDPTPLEMEVTARFDATVVIQNGQLAVSQLTQAGTTRVHAVSVPAGVDPNVLNALVAVAGDLVDKVMADVLKRSVVGFPVPNLHFPQTLGPVTLPAPLTLAISNPALSSYGTYPLKYMVVAGQILEQ